MEIYGYIPIQPQFIPNDTIIKENKLFVSGSTIVNDDPNVNDKVNLVVIAKCIVSSNMPTVDGVTSQDKFNKTNSIESSIIAEYKNGMISNSTNIKVLDKNGNVQVISNLEGIIVNYIDKDTTSNLVDNTLDDISKIIDSIKVPNIEIDNIFDRDGILYENYYQASNNDKIYQLSNGNIVEKDIRINGVNKKITEWEGTFPLDQMIKLIKSNLDILLENGQIKGDQYSIYYTNQFNQALQLATDLEKHRIALYEQSSEFRIKNSVDFSVTLLNSKLSSLKLLTDTQLVIVNKSLSRMQTKLYHIQGQGFKSNSVYKLFDSQLSGISSSFSSGMLESPPLAYNNTDLLELYSVVSNLMIEC